MVTTARDNVPNATFRKMDMTEIDFPLQSFDGVISTYAIIHVPRENHAKIFQSFHSILKPKGIMLVSVASWAFVILPRFCRISRILRSVLSNFIIQGALV